MPVVYFESPYRFLKNLELLQSFHPQITVFVGRELTKIHEQLLSDKIEKIISYYRENPDKVKGEFVIIVKNSS